MCTSSGLGATDNRCLAYPPTPLQKVVPAPRPFLRVDRKRATLLTSKTKGRLTGSVAGYPEARNHWSARNAFSKDYNWMAWLLATSLTNRQPRFDHHLGFVPEFCRTESSSVARSATHPVPAARAAAFGVLLRSANDPKQTLNQYRVHRQLDSLERGRRRISMKLI